MVSYREPRSAIRDSSTASQPQRAGTRSRLAVALAAFATSCTAALGLYLAAGPIVTDDTWFHLAVGEAYLTQGPWPDSDPLLHTAHEDAPVQHEWLFGVALHALDRLLGLQGLRVVHALAALAILALAGSLFRRQAPCAEAAWLATACFCLLAWWRLWQLRPDLASIPATLLLYRLLLESPEHSTPLRIAAAVGLLTVWANLHSLFAIGLALLLAALLGVGLRALLAYWAGARAGVALLDAPGERRSALALGSALGLGLVASLLNPRGIGQHLTFLTSSTEFGVWRVRDEWTPFNPFDWEGYAQNVDAFTWLLADLVLVAFVAASAIGLWHLLRRPSRSTLDGFDGVAFGLAAAAVVAMLTSVRFLWMSVFPILFVSRVARAELAGRETLARRLAWACVAATVVLAAVYPFTDSFDAVASVRRSGARYFADAFVKPKYHVAGVSFLRESGLEGNLYNNYNMGGFLGYWLAPRLQTFVDGRTEHYPPEVLDDYGAVERRRGRLPGERLGDVLARRSVDVFFGSGIPSARLRLTHTAGHLASDPDWILVSRSVHHGIYLRRDQHNHENLERVARYYAGQGVPFDRERGFDVAAVIEARPDWAARHELIPRDGARLLEARYSPDPEQRDRALDELGRFYALLGAYEEQIAIEREAHALRPDAEGPLRRLLYALLRSGQLVEAQRVAGLLERKFPDSDYATRAVAITRRFLTLQERRAAGASGVPTGENMLDGFPLLDAEEEREVLQRFHYSDLETE